MRAAAASSSTSFSSRVSTSRTELKSWDVTVVQTSGGPPVYSFDGVLQTGVVGAEPSQASPAVFTGLTELNDIAQGAAFYQRVGSKVVMKSLQLEFDLVNTAATVWRYMLIYDRQPNGAFPTYSSILAQNDGAPVTWSGINQSYKNRFLVLRDKRICFDPASMLVFHAKEYVKTSLPVEFKANGGTIGDIATGAVYLLAYTEVSGATSQIRNINSRIRYLD